MREKMEGKMDDSKENPQKVIIKYFPEGGYNQILYCCIVKVTFWG